MKPQNVLIGLIGLFLFLKKRNRAKIGDLEYIIQGSITNGVKKLKEAVQIVRDGNLGIFNNGEIIITSDGVQLSYDLHKFSGIKQNPETWTELRRAISALKRKDKVLIFSQTIEAETTNLRRKEILRLVEDYLPTEGAYTDEQAFIKTLYDIATRNVLFKWKTTGQQRGLEEQLFGKSAPEERKYFKDIVNDKKGITPEAYAENISYDPNQTDFFRAVLDAISTTGTPASAFKVLSESFGQSQPTTPQTQLQNYNYDDVPF